MKKFNHWLATTVVLTTVVSPIGTIAATNNNSVTTAMATNFTDLGKADAWAQGAIAKAKELGLLSGDEKGNFRPHDTLTRQELAVILTKALKLEVPKVTSSSFVDVDQSTWARDYIEAVKHAGLIVGDGNGHYRPNDLISREELAVVLAKALNMSVNGKGSQLSVADKDTVSSWAKDYVQAVIELGLMKGDGVHFNPKSHTTRQEIAVVVVTFTDLLHANQTEVIDSLTDDQVTMNGVSYTLSDQVKGILNKGNADVLKGAKIKFEASHSTLNKITYLEITNSGKATASGEKEFSGDLVLDGNGATVNGDLKISGDYISLKNLNVSGDLVIGQELQNDFYSSNLKVTGKTVVNGGAPNTVVFDHAALGAVQVNKQNVRVEPTGSTTMNELTVQSNATITADADVTIPKLTVMDGVDHVEINASVTDVNLTGTHDVSVTGSGTLGNVTVAGSGNVALNTTGSVGTVNVTDPGSKLSILGTTKISNLVLPSGTKASDVIQNYDQVKGQVSNVNGTQNPDTPVPSSGGGGVVPSPTNGDLTAPTLMADTTYNNTATPLDITFADNATWRGAITAVKNGSSTLTAGTDYTVIGGKITIHPNVLSEGTNTITVVANGYKTATVSQVVVAAPVVLSNPTLTVYAPNVDQTWGEYAANNVYQVNVNFTSGTTSSDFTSAEVSLYNGDTLLATNTAKQPLLNSGAAGLTDLFGMGDSANPTDDTNWNIGTYSPSEVPTKVVFTLTDIHGAVYTAEAPLTTN